MHTGCQENENIRAQNKFKENLTYQVLVVLYHLKK